MNSGRENVSGGRSMRERKRTGRRRRPGIRRTAGPGRIILHMVLPWILVFFSGILLLQQRSQINQLNAALSRTLSRLLVLEDRESVSPEYGEEAQTVIETTVLSDYAKLWGMDSVDKPVERTYRQILARLKELGEENKLIEQVAGNADRYPEQLLEALANNPEMADFAVHYLENKGTVTGEGLTENEKSTDFPLFLQWDPRWGYASYGDDSVVGLSGCGPTALSMVLYYLTGDESLTPDSLASYSMENGYYISGTGTAWLLLEQVPLRYGLAVDQPEVSEYGMKQALDKGRVIICSMRPGDFTVGGHFVVIYGYDQEGFLLNDPNCVARSRVHWTYDQLESQIKHLWVFGKDGQSGSGVTNGYGDINVWTETVEQ